MNASEREGQTQIALFPQCTARVDALHCRSGCSALRKRLQCTAGKEHIMADRDLSSGVLPSRHQSACGFSFYHGFNGLDGLFPMRDCEQDKNQDKPFCPGDVAIRHRTGVYPCLSPCDGCKTLRGDGGAG